VSNHQSSKKLITSVLEVKKFGSVQSYSTVAGQYQLDEEK